ncbi:MAG: OsmC family protein [Chloroflexota bacterium]|nr:OsmC family protein [Chloroflexota bacterium]
MAKANTKSKSKASKSNSKEGKTATRPVASPNGAHETLSFRDRQRTLKNAYKIHGGLGRQTSAVHTVTPPDADTGKVRIAIDNPAGIEVDIGAHVSVGGVEDVGCSGDYFLASLAGCYEITLRLVAAASKVTINRIDLRVEGDWDARGTLGMSPEIPVGFTDIRILVDLEADGPEDRLVKLAELTEQYCVVSQTLKHPPRVEISLV